MKKYIIIWAIAIIIGAIFIIDKGMVLPIEPIDYNEPEYLTNEINQVYNKEYSPNEIKRVDNKDYSPNNIVSENSNKGQKGLEKTKIDTIPILMYHHICEDPKQWNSIIISPEKFEEDMLYLKAMGYNTIHFKDYIGYVENNGTLPLNPIIITFDDGYESNYTYAYPILKELNMKATISIIGNLIGLKQEGGLSYLSWNQIKEMFDSGVIDIQHHSYNLHKPSNGDYKGGVLPMIDEEPVQYKKRFEEDTLKLKKEIKLKLGNEVNVYTYPYGFYNDTVEKILSKLGFKFTLTVENGLASINKGYTLKRINVPQYMSSIDLIKTLQDMQKLKKEVVFENVYNREERIEKLQQMISDNF